MNIINSKILVLNYNEHAYFISFGKCHYIHLSLIILFSKHHAFLSNSTIAIENRAEPY